MKPNEGPLPRAQQVILSEELRGGNSTGNFFRRVLRVHTLDGVLIAEHDLGLEQSREAIRKAVSIYLEQQAQDREPMTVANILLRTVCDSLLGNAIATGATAESMLTGMTAEVSKATKVFDGCRDADR